MINMIRNSDKSWTVTVTWEDQRVYRWFVGGSKTEIMREAKRELARMQAGQG